MTEHADQSESKSKDLLPGISNERLERLAAGFDRSHFEKGIPAGPLPFLMSDADRMDMEAATEAPIKDALNEMASAAVAVDVYLLNHLPVEEVIVNEVPTNYRNS